MKTRFMTGISVVLALVALIYAAGHFRIESRPPPAHAALPPRTQSYLGVYEDGAPPDYQPVANFAKAAGGQPNLVGYYSGWAEPFAMSFAEQIRNHGATPYVQIDPTYASVAAVAAGTYDGYLRSYADSVRNFRDPVVIGFGHEMNATTYSWGYKHLPPATFVAAWRHIVTLFRQQGAGNVTWLWTVNAGQGGSGPPISLWWPGARYVTWVGIDGYYYRPSDTFKRVFGGTIGQVRKLTTLPVLLSETAVGPRTGQFGKISNLFSGMRAYRVLGLVWFDKHQHDGILHQDWRIEGNFQATTAFQLGVQGLTLARPR
jgi:mannan endo-1,4-beta-mannosidase